MTNWSSIKIKSTETKKENKEEYVDWLKESEDIKKECKIKTKSLPWYIQPIIKIHLTENTMKSLP